MIVVTFQLYQPKSDHDHDAAPSGGTTTHDPDRPNPGPPRPAGTAGPETAPYCSSRQLPVILRDKSVPIMETLAEG